MVLRRGTADMGSPRGTLPHMTVPMPDPYVPGARLPDPTAPNGPTRWGARMQDYATAPDGASPWSDAAEPGAVPPATEPVTERVEWLVAGRPEHAA